ncbi:MAG: DUF1513 domain-containing protein [Candidatus Omnitrophota bacterium]|jgi:YVTN family beta-propeller protein|nr:MAG: DUF1513 domain-containing protein [Candidatus Omnitrophota bacterium]
MKSRTVDHLFIPILPFLFLFGSLSAHSADPVYVGEQKCRECHHLSGNRNQYTPWRLSQHANAYAALAMPESMEIARLSGIDVEPVKSPICLGCHTTASTAEDWEKDPTFHPEDGIQCEFCHGPGSEYMPAEIMQDKKRAKEAGLVMPDERFCMVCHKEKGSHVAVLKVKKFDYQEALKEIAHAGRGGQLSETPAKNITPRPGPKFVGAIACGQCHDTAAGGYQYSKWHLSNHARAYAVLGTEAAKKIARDKGIEEDPQTVPECLRCHATAGAEPEDGLLESFDLAQGVQCESCHGPGSEYMAEAIMLDPVAARNAGLMEVNRETCLKCHPQEVHGKPYDFEAMGKKIEHCKPQEIQTGFVEYKTPFNLAVARDGKRLFVACEGSDSLIVVDADSGTVITEIKIENQPHHVCFSPDETRVYVSNRGSDSVSVIDANSYEVLNTIPVGDEPHEMATDVKGKLLYVANCGSYDVSVVDLVEEKEIKRLSAGRGTWGMERSPDGNHIYVTSNLSHFVKFRTPSVSEVTVIGTERSQVVERYMIPEANLVQGIDFSPDGEFALVTLIRTKNLVPMTRVIQGWVINNGIGVLWRDGRVDQLLLDEVDSYFPDPTDVVITRDGRYGFVSSGGINIVAMLDLNKMKQVLEQASEQERKELLPNHRGMSFEYIIKHIPVGRSPRGMAISPDNRYVYVADGLDDCISVIDIEKRERIRVIDLGGPKEITLARYGQRIFHCADITFGKQFSCHSCHPDGGIDGITYDIEPDGIGINPVDNRTLRGILDTAPFKWEGTNPSLRRQCGPRLAVFFTRSDPFTLEQADALDRYICTIVRSPNRYLMGNELTAAQRRGKEIFERTRDNMGNEIPLENRCDFCHCPPYYTNREVFNVGSASWLDTNEDFDVPQLNNIYESAPFLHDGRADTLEEIWTRFNPHDTHGVTNDMTKDELNDLVEYIKTL